MRKFTPFAPESAESLKARLEDAFAVRHVTREIGGKTVCEPPIDERNIFDFENGWRLIIARDALLGRDCLHLSASFSGSEVPRTAAECMSAIGACLNDLGLIVDIGDGPHRTTSPYNLPHWWWDAETREPIFGARRTA